jgi:hypothetical protein
MKNPVIRYGVALILVISGVWGSVKLMTVHSVSELSFVSLIGITVFASALVFFSDRLREFSISEMKVVLSEMRDTRRDVKELAAAVLDVFEKKSHVLMMQTYDAKAASEAMERLRKLIA